MGAEGPCGSNTGPKLGLHREKGRHCPRFQHLQTGSFTVASGGQFCPVSRDKLSPLPSALHLLLSV